MPPVNTHHMNTLVEDKREADAIAWGAVEGKQGLVEIPFKHYALRAGEIRVKITHSGVCHSDVHTIVGEWGHTALPCVPGHEVIGNVVAVAPDVTNFRIGERVGLGPLRNCCGTCEYCKNDADHLCPFVNRNEAHLYPQMFGGYATEIQAYAKYAFHIPEALPSEKAAPLLCAGVTVFAPLKRHTKPGDKVAIVGIGGLGHVAIRFAAAMGLDVTAVSSTAEKEEEARSFGAQHFLSSSDTEAMKNAYGTFDFVLCTVSGASAPFDQYIKLVKIRGTLCLLGAPPVDRLPIHIMDLIMAEKKLVASLVGSYKSTEAMLQFAAEHGVVPQTELFPVSKIQEGFDRCQHNKARYRVVLDVESYDKNAGSQ
eukprot:GILK01003448.1.p1 GENE.GILK01003448.1~~GILK01003448.1.p1  ORF type:complete len:368 (-),score=56.20 GILK01003448.1:158-1261(-)